MSIKPGRWCARCKAVHAGKCPDAPVWQKRINKPSGRGGRPWRRKRELVFERDGFMCCNCLHHGIETVVTLHGELAGICDHIVSLEEGGTDAMHNLQTLCKKCSDEKTQVESQRGRGRVKP